MDARSDRDRDRDGSTQQPRSVTVVTDLGFKSNSNMHPRAFYANESANRSTANVDNTSGLWND